MPHLYFDFRDDAKLIRDEIGLHFDTLEEASREATRALAEIAQDVLPGSARRVLVIEVREGERPVLEARMVFEIRVLAK